MVVALDSDHFAEATMRELAASQSLFGATPVVLGTDLFTDAVRREFLLGSVEQMAVSPTVFLFREGKLDAKDISAFKSHAKLFEELRGGGEAAFSDFPKELFAVGDALVERNKKTTWVAYQRALLIGHAEEEIFWTLVRQVKNMALVKSGGTIADLGTSSDNVYRKAVAGAKNFSLPELTKLHGDLVALFHDSHRGNFDFDVGLERWLLTI